jgi:flagellar motor switch protein FliN/FliY
MANEQSLSQDEIDQLLASVLTDTPELPTKGMLSGADMNRLQEFLNLALGSAVNALGNILQTPLSATINKVVEVATLDAWEPPATAEESLLIQFAEQAGDQVLVLVAQAEADALLGEDLSTPLNTIGPAIASSLAAMLPKSLKFEAALYTAFSLDALPELNPTLAQQPFVQAQASLSLPDGNQLSLTLVWDSPAASAILKSLQQSQAAPSRPASQESATAGGGNGGGGGFASRPENPVTVQPVQFSAFDQSPNLYGDSNRNLDLVMDIGLNLTVELGKTEISIKEVLELTRGSVIELDRIAGEPVDLFANGKLIAKGEVVVIEDNFGLRITSIVSPAERLRGL